MFDSLREKFGEFRDDVEETAEQKAAEAEAEAETASEGEEGSDAEAEADTGSGTETEGETAATADAHAAPDLDTPDEPGSETERTRATETPGRDGDTDDSFVAPVPDDGASAESRPDAGPDDEERPATPQADAPESDRDGDSDGTEETPSTGLGRKVKSLARGKFVIEEEDLEDPLWELEMALLESDVEMSVAEEILDGIREELVGETRGFRESTGSLVEAALREALLDVIGVGQFDFEARVRETDRPVVIVFTGVNGVGKTTTIAKLARYFGDSGLSTVLANGDTYRAGANEQIQEHADRLGKRLISHEQGGDPAAVIYDAVEYAEANDVDVVLGDTAGRLHTDQGLMDQLEKIHRVVDPDMTLFVDEAVAGQDAVRRAEEFDAVAEIDGTVLTKADADSQGGAAISIAHVTGEPILFLGTGQGYDDLERFDPDRMVDRLIGDED